MVDLLVLLKQIHIRRHWLPHLLSYRSAWATGLGPVVPNAAGTAGEKWVHEEKWGTIDMFIMSCGN